MKPMRFVDVAVNLTDCVFRGVHWNSKRLHEDDFSEILARAKSTGVEKILISGTNLGQIERAIALCREHPGVLYCTVGIHPSQCIEFTEPLRKGSGLEEPFTVAKPPQNVAEGTCTLDPAIVAERIDYLVELIENNKDIVLAIGEVGLDYAELAYTPKDIQHQMFERQFELVERTGLPMFLHSRDCDLDFVEILRRNRSKFGKGVVHSFNGSRSELEVLKELEVAIGLNMSAFRTKDVAEQCLGNIPPNLLMLETDAPWCDARKDNYGFPFIKTKFPTRKKDKFIMGQCVERRNEPCHMVQVLEACHGVIQAMPENHAFPGYAEMSLEDLAALVFKNATEMFAFYKE